MPGGDRTGPMGMGPMTGRAAGYCAGSTTPGFMNSPTGRGFGGGGYGRGGGGRGRRNQFYATGLTGWQRAAAGQQAFGAVPNANPVDASKEQELAVLKQQLQAMQSQMQQLQDRISQLQTTEPSE